MRSTNPLLPSDIIHIYRQVMRALFPMLDLYERSVVLFILDRTIGWSKFSETISVRQIACGMVDENGATIAAASKVSERKVFDVLRMLIENEIITTDKGAFGEHGARSYALNIDKETLMLRLPKNGIKREGPALRTSKTATNCSKTQSKSASKAATNCSDLCTPCSPPPAPHAVPPLHPVPNKRGIEYKEEQNINGLSEAASGREDEGTKTVRERIQERVQQSQGKTLAILQKKHETAKSNKLPSVDELLAIWNKALADEFPHMPASFWKGREKGMVAQMRARYASGEHKLTFGAFLDWCVRNWRPVLSSEFRGMQERVPNPSLEFLVRFETVFINLLARWDEKQAELAMGTRALKIKRLVDQGMPQEVAEAEVDQVLGITAERQKLAQERVSLQRARQSLERAEVTARLKRSTQVSLEELQASRARSTAPATQARDYRDTDLSSFDVSFGEYKSPEERGV